MNGSERSAGHVGTDSAGESCAKQRVIGGCALFAVGMVGVILAALLPPGLRGRALIAAHLVISAGMLLAWTGRPDARALRWILWLGVAARLALIPVPSFTTHDPERYLWDGFVARSGVDPWVHPPNAPELASLRTEWPVPRDNRTVPTIYPPGAMWLFAGVSLAGGAAAPWVWKVIVVLASCLSCVLVARWLGRTGREKNLPLYSLSPLALIESGIGAHLDALTACAVAVALNALPVWLFVGRSEEPAQVPPRSGYPAVAMGTGPGVFTALVPRAGTLHSFSAALALGVGTLLKLTPALVLVPLVFGRKRLSVGVLATLTIAAGYGAAMLLGFRPLGSLGTFVARWRFGSPLFSAVENLFGSPIALTLASVLLCALLMLSVFLARRSFAAASGLALVAPLVAGPVVFPWYFLTALPLLSFAPSFAVLAWVTSLPLTYEVIDLFDRTGRWAPSKWPLMVIALSVLSGAIVDAARWRSAEARRPVLKTPPRAHAGEPLSCEQNDSRID